MTPGPPHCIANAPPATSPIAPSPAATLEAEPWTPASTRPELTRTPWRHCSRGLDAPAPSLNPENEPPPSTSPPPALLTMHPPPELVPAPPLPPQTAPPSASDAPASPAPLTLAPSPCTPMCSFPAPLPLSPSVPRHGPPLPVGAHPPILPMMLSKPPPACEGRPP
ncbi:hypothetical protein E4T56_gene2584 [Termitomyces sp. T112]|nr:hypothetical protein E4T56_gene2584 [Termitomyces sp. T112]